MAGSLAYQVYTLVRNRNWSVWLMRLCWLIIPVLIFYYPHAGWMAEHKRRWLFYGIVFVLIPFVFHYTRNFKWDRWIGELSFPIYIGHHVIMMVVKRYFWTHTEHMYWFGVCTVAGSIIFAVVLWKLVIDPIERIRQRRVIQTQT